MLRERRARAPAMAGVGLGTLLLGAFAAPASAQPATADASRADSATVAAAVDAFHRALVDGDSAAVESLLAADAVILEGEASRAGRNTWRIICRRTSPSLGPCGARAHP